MTSNLADNARANARRAAAAALLAMMVDVDQFQKEILGLPVKHGPLEPHRFKFKLDHMREELDEFEEAYNRHDFAGQLDALVDLQYVTFGATLEMGINPDEAFATVHDANMQKMRGTTKRGESYDAIKPEGWQPPDHEALIVKMELLSRVAPSLLEATAIAIKRGAAYNAGTVKREDHFPLGVTSVFQMMWVKLMRMRSDIEAGVVPNLDHFDDIINYAGFGKDAAMGRPMR